jgi:hypothetical protein
MILTGRNRSTRRKACRCATVSTPTPLIPHGLKRNRTRPSAVQGRQTTAYTTTRTWKTKIIQFTLRIKTQSVPHRKHRLLTLELPTI